MRSRGGRRARSAAAGSPQAGPVPASPPAPLVRDEELRRHRQSVPPPLLASARTASAPMRRGPWRKLRIVAMLATATLLLAVAAFLGWLSPRPLGDGPDYSPLVVDRDGKLLRPYATAEGRCRLPATPQTVDPRFID